MIPKKIHYCWFGRGEKPKLAKKCIDSWKRICPDYEIIEWNEDNFDIDMNGYTRYCYDNKKYAFLSDYVRLVVVSKYGGIYFDTDVELVKSPAKFLDYEAYYGFENNHFVASGLGFGSTAHHPVIEEMRRLYEEMLPDEDGNYTFIGCPKMNTQALVNLGLKVNGKIQNVCGARILSQEYMNPYDDAIGKLNQTDNTISIHWYSKSWMNKSVIIRSKVTRVFHRVFGVNCFRWLK